MAVEPLTLSTVLAREEEKILACVHCGLCLEACPTYVITGDEKKEATTVRARNWSAVLGALVLLALFYRTGFSFLLFACEWRLMTASNSASESIPTFASQRGWAYGSGAKAARSS